MTAYDLMADNGDGLTGFKAGEVQVWNDDDTLYVKYKITDMDWCLTGTHLAVAEFLADIPQNKSHNPKVGQFEFSESHDCAAEHMYEMPLPTYDPVIAAHADLLSIDVAAPGEFFWATSVVDSSLGYRNYFGQTTRLTPGSALHIADGVFYSLGFGSAVNDGKTGFPEAAWVGEIIVAFDGWVYNGDGYDISVHETTNGRALYPEETVDVYGWYDSEWVLLGTGSNHDNGTGIGLIELGALPYVEKVKIVDTSDFDLFYNVKSTWDGYDLNAVDAPVLYYGEESGWAGPLDFGGKSWATYFNYEVLEFVVIETVDVPSETPAGMSSTIPLDAGEAYTLKASGTYQYGNGPRMADAQCSDRTGAGGWLNGDGLTAAPNYLEVWVDGSAFNWTPTAGCQTTSHLYEGAFTGTGGTVAFHIPDSCSGTTLGCYTDNIGSITVEIWGWS